jgi:hypothetical protein
LKIYQKLDRVWDIGYWILNTGCVDVGYYISDTSSQILDGSTGFSILDTGYWLVDGQFILNSGY